MHTLGYLVITLAKIIQLITNLYTFIIGAAVILSWVSPDPYNPIVRVIRQATEPLFNLARRFMPSFLYKTGIDFSPILVLIVIIFIENFIVNILFELGQGLLSK